MTFFKGLFCFCIMINVSACTADLKPIAKNLAVESHIASKALTPRSILLADNAFSGSSVNVLAGVRQTLYTDSIYQYAGFYNGEGRLVLAKRRLGEDHWQKQVTPFSGNVNDAHNHISLVVDGNGFLHVAWDHHNNALRYARSVTAGSLTLEKSVMLGQQENSVTYPQFYRLNSGDLLFGYRDGGSGHGTLVLNRYSANEKKWQRLHNSLIDGEAQRSAYWDMSLDKQGVLHLAWIWRETPDVATNHDIAYAQSADNGQTWFTVDKKPYQLPITEKTAQVIKHIPQNSTLMNPPVVAADNHSNPFIASYWADSPAEKPRYHVLYHKKNEEKQGQWHEIKAPEVAENFSLNGLGTKNPPISRAALLVESNWQSSWFHLIYRDDFHDGNIIAASVTDLEQPQWQHRILVDDNMGAWEPSIDVSQWNRMKQAHMLLQKVGQQDGNDQQGLGSDANAIKVLIWSPDWEKHQALSPIASKPTAANLSKPLAAKNILDIAEKAAQWQWQHFPQGWNYHPRAWGLAPFYIGNLAIAKLLPESNLTQLMLDRANEINWQPHERIYDADDYVVLQAYLELYQQFQSPKMLSPAKARLDYILANQSPASLDWGTPNNRDRWSWSDSLFMAPDAWMLMYQITGEEKYLNFINKEWWATAERLYRPEIGLYFRDESYLDIRERNGKTIHWARGIGWSIAGLARVLQRFPKNHPDYPRYVEQFKTMSAAFLAAQQNDGLWRPGLLDPNTHTAKETSGSAFAVFALAWGVNNQLLDQNSYLPAIIKGWNALADCVTPAGKLAHVQPIGAAPHGFDPENSEPFATGAFLLAASEVYRLAE